MGNLTPPSKLHVILPLLAVFLPTFYLKPITPSSLLTYKSHLTNTMSEQEKPLTAYPSTELKAQDQEGGPGLDSKLEPAANWSQLEYWGDDGKPYLKEYEGRGLLQDKAVLITGGDSGIGRSVAILMAREGADISFVYLEEEEEDAQYTKRAIEKAGRKAHLMPLNLREEENCKKAVDGHLKAFGKLNVLVNNSKYCPAHE
jgi:predicted ATP-dependent serine protease